MLSNFICVGIGGFLGAIARYSIGLGATKYLPTAFPIATFTVNVIGSLCLGLLAALIMQEAVSEKLALFIGVGFLGAFTTFSTFSLDIVYLYKSQHYWLCLINFILTPVISIFAAALGIRLLR